MTNKELQKHIKNKSFVKSKICRSNSKHSIAAVKWQAGKTFCATLLLYVDDNLISLRLVEKECNTAPTQTDGLSSCNQAMASVRVCTSRVWLCVCVAVLTLLMRPLKRTSSAFSCCTRRANSSWQPSLSCRSCNTTGCMRTLRNSGHVSKITQCLCKV